MKVVVLSLRGMKRVARRYAQFAAEGQKERQ